MVPLVFFAASCFVGGKKIHVRKRQEATLTSLPNKCCCSAEILNSISTRRIRFVCLLLLGAEKKIRS